MSSQTQTEVRTETGTGFWHDAILAGLVAGIVMGFMIQFIMGIMPVIGALYGSQTLVAGWVAHLFHSVVFALLFGAIVSRPALSNYAQSISGSTAVGAGYGVALWVVAAGFVMPIWMRTLELGTPPVPNFNPMSLVGHLVFGIVLGATFAVLRRR